MTTLPLGDPRFGAGTSPFERGTSTDPFLLAQRPPRADRRRLAIGPSGGGEVGEAHDLHALYSLGARDARIVADDVAALGRRLRTIRSLDQLDFLYHGEAASMQIGGQQLALTQVADQLAGVPLPEVADLRFMNCLVMRDPAGVLPLARAFRARRAIGFNQFRVLLPHTVRRLTGTAAERATAVVKALHGFDAFLVEGTRLEQLPVVKGTVTLLLEFFGNDVDEFTIGTIKRELGDPEGRPGLLPFSARRQAVLEVLSPATLAGARPVPTDGRAQADVAQAALSANRQLREITITFP